MNLCEKGSESVREMISQKESMKLYSKEYKFHSARAALHKIEEL
jgi:hypothetical protein